MDSRHAETDATVGRSDAVTPSNTDSSLADSPIEFHPVPAWWVPVWAELQRGSGVLNPLEEAVLAMVAAGQGEVDSISGWLCVPPAVVEAARDGLVLKNLLELTAEGSLAVVPQGLEEEGAGATEVREGWVAWDETGARLLPSVWLDRRYPQAGELSPNARLGSRPQRKEVDEELRRLPHLHALTLVEPLEAGLKDCPNQKNSRRVDTGRLRTLRLRKDGGARRGSVFVAVEQRPGNLVVWRPSLVQDPTRLGELDPRGIEGLQDRTPDLADEAIRRLKEAADDRLAPLLADAGYASVDEMKEAARLRAAREVGGSWSPQRWPRTCAAIERAVLDQEVASLVAHGWRGMARGWADVFEALTLELVAPARRILDKAGQEGRLPALPPEQLSKLSRALGPTWDHLKPLVDPARQGKALKKLRSALTSDSDSIGTRLYAMGVAAWMDREYRRQVLAAARTMPGVFRELSRANQERIAVVHIRERREEVDPVAFRDRVMQLCAVWMGAGEA